MATKKPRINITFEQSTVGFLTSLAQKEDKSVASLAKELILEALDRREDMVLSALAEVRDTEKAETIKHDDVWK